MNKPDLLAAINNIGNASCDLCNACDSEVEKLLADPWLDKLDKMENDLTRVYENILLQEVGIESKVDVGIFMHQDKSYRETIVEGITAGMDLLIEEETKKKKGKKK